MFANQIFQPIDGLAFGNIKFYGSLSDVKIDLAGSTAHISKIRIGHFSWSVHDTSHDGDLDALEM